MSSQKIQDLNSFPEVKKVFKNNLPQTIMCHQEGEHILSGNVPIAKLKDFLL